MGQIAFFGYHRIFYGTQKFYRRKVWSLSFLTHFQTYPYHLYSLKYLHLKFKNTLSSDLSSWFSYLYWCHQSFWFIEMLRTLYHFTKEDIYLWMSCAMYLLVLCSGIATLVTPTFNNMDSRLLKDFSRNVNILTLITFVVVYLVQIVLFSYNPLLNDTADRTFQFLTALIEIVTKRSHF